jgi:hypothetical protein
MTKSNDYDGVYGGKYNGNSILLKVNKDTNDYVFIGRKVYSFTSLYPIVSFLSPIGRADVPYPYSVDNHNNLYLMIEYVIIKMDNKLLDYASDYDNPYYFYYDYIDPDQPNELCKNMIAPYIIPMNHKVLNTVSF